MQKVNRPKGLIRYDSYNSIEQGDKKRLNARTAAYSGVLSLILIILISLLATRDPVETTILRTPGTLFQETADGQISNLYNIKIINKTFKDILIDLKLRNKKARLELIGGDLLIPGGELKESSFFIKIPKNDLSISSARIRIDVYSGGDLIDEIVTSFMKPNRTNKQ